MTPNEARRQERLAPVTGGDGAFLQRQMTPIDMLTDLARAELTAALSPAPDPQADPPAAEDQGRSIFEMLTKEVAQPAQRKDLAAEILKEMHSA